MSENGKKTDPERQKTDEKNDRQHDQQHAHNEPPYRPTKMDHIEALHDRFEQVPAIELDRSFLSSITERAVADLVARGELVEDECGDLSLAEAENSDGSDREKRMKEAAAHDIDIGTGTDSNHDADVATNAGDPGSKREGKHHEHDHDH